MKKYKVALIGNANVGKTTIFNQLCGLNQKTGNYPGVTVDKKKGQFKFQNNEVEVVDLPGFTSLNPTSKDEELVVEFLEKSYKENSIDKVVYVANANDFKKSLYLLTQVKDLGFPCMLVINMNDVALKKGIHIDKNKLSELLNIPVELISARSKNEIENLKEIILKEVAISSIDLNVFSKEEYHQEIKDYTLKIKEKNEYRSFLALAKDNPELRKKEPILRYQYVNKLIEKAFHIDKEKAQDLTTKLDKILLHKFFGYVIFLLILFLIFQSVFWLASYPMDWIDMGMGWLKDSVASSLPEGMLNDLLVNGVLEGLGGVVIFIPQIAILFLFFSLMEESGYMARVVYLMDKFMQKLGMSGKSIIPIVGSFACAVPSIMSTRTIQNYKERLITILVSPLITCSARIPVYTVIISIIIPEENWLGFNLQGIVLFGMYLLGVVTMILGALVFKWIIKSKYKSFFILEMPDYLVPNLRSVGLQVWNNSKSFVWNAGKVIVAVTIIIFVLQSNGNNVYKQADHYVATQNWTEEDKADAASQLKEQNSYLAIGGKFIEPVIKPLGYDWKVGIGVLASIAAREVFVGTMLVVYGGTEEEEEDDLLIADRLRQQVNENTGERTFNFATGISLLLFYAFSLQCISTIAVTYKETQSLKWTSIQFLYMTGLAYLAAFIAYQVLS